MEYRYLGSSGLQISALSFGAWGEIRAMPRHEGRETLFAILSLNPLVSILGFAWAAGFYVWFRDRPADHPRVNEAELYRLQGELLRKTGAGVPQIENTFQKALEIARAQGAKGVELRIAVSLGKFWVEETKPGDAQALLEEVCSWHSKGFETKDFLPPTN